jgi:hypothetical protein
MAIPLPLLKSEAHSVLLLLLLQVGVQQEILKWIKNMFQCLISIMMNGLSSL